MIEFTPDSPFAQKPDLIFPDRVRIVGLGQTGVAVVDQLVLHGQAPRDLWVFDSDQQTIEGSIVPNRHLLGHDLVHGLGCGGDLALAREMIAFEEPRLTPVAHDCDFLILIVSLAGATGVAVADHLAQIGRLAGAKVIVIGVQPFAFEGAARREKSAQAIAKLRREADGVLVLNHDRVAQDAASVKNVRHGFHLMHQLLAQAAQSLAQVVCKRGLVQLSFADVRALYGRYTGTEVLENCWLGHVESDTESAVEDIVAQLLASPILADETIWKQVDHAMVTVSGSRDLGLSDVQELIGALKEQMPERLPLAVSASLDEDSPDKVRMTLLLAMTAPAQKPETVAPVPVMTKKIAPPKVIPIIKTEPAVEVAIPKVRAERRGKPQVVSPSVIMPEVIAEEPDSKLAPEHAGTSAIHKAKQEEMIFEGPTRGRFEKTHETIYRGENLDQPTFRRRRLAIRV